MGESEGGNGRGGEADSGVDVLPSLGEVDEVEGGHGDGLAEDADDDAATLGLLGASAGLDLDVEEDLLRDGVVGVGGGDARQGHEGHGPNQQLHPRLCNGTPCPSTSHGEMGGSLTRWSVVGEGRSGAGVGGGGWNECGGCSAGPYKTPRLFTPSVMRRPCGRFHQPYADWPLPASTLTGGQGRIQLRPTPPTLLPIPSLPNA